MNDEIPFRITLVILAILHTLVTVYYGVRALFTTSIFRKREEGVPLTLLMTISYLGYVTGFLLYLIDPRWMQWSSLPLPSWIRWAALVPTLLGTVLIAWGMNTLGRNFALCVSPQESSSLVTSGPYRWIRHPLYTAYFFQAGGICLIMANWFVAVCAAGLWVFLIYRTPMEEEQLTRKFGDDYRDLVARTGRYFPKSKST